MKTEREQGKGEEEIKEEEDEEQDQVLWKVINYSSKEKALWSHCEASRYSVFLKSAPQR